MLDVRYIRTLARTLAFAAAASVTGAQAQSYPAKPVTIIIPLASTAGAINIETRLYAQKLSEALGQPFLVDYKPGAGGTIGVAYVAKSAPDGYTLLSTTGTMTIAPAFYKNLPYDPVKDLAPITLMSMRTTVVVASPSAPFRTIREYVAYARAHPDEVNIGTTGSGGSPHLAAAWLHNITGTRATYVPYKSVAASFTDMLAGRVQVTYTSLGSALPLIKSGKLVLMGVGNAERSPSLPDAPTVAEQDVPGFDYTSFLGFLAPARTPAPVIARLNAEFVKISRDADIAQKIGADGAAMVGSTPEQFGRLVANEVSRFARLVRDTGIKFEE